MATEAYVSSGGATKLDYSLTGVNSRLAIEKGLAEAYARRDVLRGCAVRTSDPAVPEGVAEGVAADGALLVQAAGQVHRIVSGEVSVRPLQD